MGPNIDAARKAGLEARRPHVVEKHEGPHHSPPHLRQHAPDLEPAEVLALLVDDEVDQGGLLIRARVGLFFIWGGRGRVSGGGGPNVSNAGLKNDFSRGFIQGNQSGVFRRCDIWRGVSAIARSLDSNRGFLGGFLNEIIWRQGGGAQFQA
jgi:hypothetical protein